jgi:hypothetical protein
VTAAQHIAVRFPVPWEFVQLVIDDCGGDSDLAECWLEACALSGRYFAPKSLKILKVLPWGEVR